MHSSGVAREARNEDASCDHECLKYASGRTRRFATRDGRMHPSLHKRCGDEMSKARIATVWLDGCSGCHMSFLDMDERLIELAALVDIVYSPLVDNKIFPEEVDLTLVEGSVSSEEDLSKIKKIREHTRLLISLGDCAITGNVPSLRNPFG